MTVPVKALIEQQMRDDDETTARSTFAPYPHHDSEDSPQVSRCSGLDVHYCQLIRQQNEVKRLQWAQEHLSDGFDSVIWTDAKRAQRSSNRAQIVLHRFIQQRIVL